MSAELTDRPSDRRIAVLPARSDDESSAAELAARLRVPVLACTQDARHLPQFQLVLLVEGGRLSLRRTGSHAPGPVTVDFGNATMRHRRQGGHNELLGRAVGVGKAASLRVLDATAGLARDSFILADMGCTVLLCERNPVLAAMLASGIRAARESDDQWLAQVAARLRMCARDARQLSAAMTTSVDVVYLDPMFERGQTRAAVKKDLATLQCLLAGEAAPADADALLHWAMALDVCRVVVKRPKQGDCLAGAKPSHTIRGRAVRYDVYVLRALPIR